MSAIYLRESDVQQLIDMHQVIDVMEDAFHHLAMDQAQNVPRVRAQAPGIVLHSMSAAAGWLGTVGWKQYTTTRQGATFHVGLYDQSTGSLAGLLEANRLGQMRTGAVTGLATRLLARPDADSVGILGAGWQAVSQLEAVAAVRSVREARVFCRTAARRDEFAAAMSTALQIPVIAVDEPREAVAGMPIVVTATSSKSPVLEGNWLQPGTLVAAIGSNWLQKSELDVETIRRADRIVCDSIACCRAEAGDFVQALKEGVFSWDQAIELADVVAGQKPGRQRDDEIILFKSVGMALEDVALAQRVLELARQRGMGQALPDQARSPSNSRQ
jgi:ornithine cyclodeaminase/alanine dehydrogenase